MFVVLIYMNYNALYHAVLCEFFRYHSLAPCHTPNEFINLASLSANLYQMIFWASYNRFIDNNKRCVFPVQ